AKQQQQKLDHLEQELHLLQKRFVLVKEEEPAAGPLSLNLSMQVVSSFTILFFRRELQAFY
ncbi:hypothetical protein EFP6CTSP_18580, partial [Enterococcus faecium]